jgi:hypothetical protein
MLWVIVSELAHPVYSKIIVLQYIKMHSSDELSAVLQFGGRSIKDLKRCGNDDEQN